MRIAGIMSGTSLDGVDVAIIDRKRGKFTLTAFHSVPYPKNVRAALLGVSNTMTHTSAISRLNFLLGELYADALLETCRRKRIPLASIDLCGMHGQTIYHEGAPADFLGRAVASTLQIGESAVVAERTGLPVIANFRERDIAAGGQGAPLVPCVDYMLFRHPKQARVALNIGGIANLTLIPKRATLEDVRAFDTGPGNMVIDALVTRMTDGAHTYDKGGAFARAAKVHAELLESMLSDPYFKLATPKSAGREQFGEPFTNGLIATGVPLADLVATATEFTARSIALAIRSISLDAEVIVSGGGVHNAWLMARLRKLLKGQKVVSSARHGVDPDAKEAIAFAILAHEAFEGRPANVPAATGARRSVLLGKHVLSL